MLAIVLSLAVGAPQAPASPQAPGEGFSWVVTDTAPPAPAVKPRAPRKPATKAPARRAKACHCSSACTCGCQDGGTCVCTSTTGAPPRGAPLVAARPLDWVGAPAYCPPMAFRPAPMMGGGFMSGGGGACRGGG